MKYLLSRLPAKSIHMSGYLFVIIMIPFLTQAQDIKNPKNKKLLMHCEVIDDPYLTPGESGRETSPPCRFTSWNFFTTQVNVDANGQNILNDAANEPSIAVDPTDPNRMVIGWRQFDNINSNFRQAGYAYTLDGGQSWTFPGVIDPGVFRSDPVVDVDDEGVFYYNSLTHDINNDFVCTVYQSPDEVVQWDQGTYAYGGDKQWMCIDRTGGIGNGHIYSFWTQYWSICYPGAFTRSVDGGQVYEDCDILAGQPHWGTMAVGPDGELYIVGAGEWTGIVVIKSNDAQDPSATITWEDVSYVNLDGDLTGWTPINPEGLLGQGIIAVDTSDGPGRGYVYVLASVDRFSNNDPADVMLARSTDGGLTWDNPICINDDGGNTNYQWFGTLSVAPNGRIDVVWLDTRDAQSNPYMSSLYYSYSLDQGLTWSENQRLSESFDPHVGWPQQQKMGDYYDMVSDNQGAHVAWAHTLNGEQDVNYGHITPLYTHLDEMPEAERGLALRCWPNPVMEQANISYRINHSGPVQMVITDVSGRMVRQLVQGVQEAGTYQYEFHTSALPRGFYYCRLTSGNKSETMKLMLVK